MSADKAGAEVMVSRRLGKQSGNVTVTSSWKSVTGTLDGTLVVSGSNDPRPTKQWTTIVNYTIDEAAQNDDIRIKTPMGWLKAIYTKNNITGGEISVFINIES